METYEKHAREAGRALNRVFARIIPLIRPGESYDHILREAEARIKEEGVREAFPPQLSMNDVAAHDTRRVDETRVLPEEGVVKLDMGIHVEGVIADAARSIAFGREAERLVRAVRAAYTAGREALMQDESIGSIGSRVETTLREAGFQPVKNLSGHGLGVYRIHTDPQIPNVHVQSQQKPAWHTAFEPFGSMGSGIVKEEGSANVFQTAWPLRTRDPIIRRAMPFFEERRGLPFSRVALYEKMGASRGAYILKRLEQEGLLIAYPPLIDTAGGWVAQWEDTFIRTTHGWECLTDDEDE